jgi:peptide deformylase
MMRAEMFRILDRHNGAGLSAPQVGMNVRMFAWKENGFCQIIWNPVLISVSGQQQSVEGCLSLPGVTVTMTRGTSSILKGIGINNLPIQFIGDAHTTRIWQHEIDHLDGKLIIDNMTKEETGVNKGTLRRLLKAFDG